MTADQLVIEPVLDAASMTEDQVLRYTQTVRMGIVRHLVGKNAHLGGMPADLEDREALFKQLDGLDKANLTKKRIQADKEANSGVSQAVGLISQLLRQSKSHYGELPQLEHREVPTLDPSIAPPTLVEGETEVDPGQLDYDSFVKNTKPA